VLNRRTLASAVALAVVATAAPAAHAQPRLPHLPTVTGFKPSLSALRANADQNALNWAGYVAHPPAGRKIVAVHSTFVVPAVDESTPGFAATWTGIGGYNTSDLIQAGIAENAPSAGFGYYAWYEILPASETLIANCTGDANCTVAPHDRIEIDITESKTKGRWVVSMVNATRAWRWSKAITYTSSYSSAEWIQEAPSVAGAQSTMPTMEDARFGSSNTFTIAGAKPQVIRAGSPTSVAMMDAGVVAEATPSPLRADGSSFTVCNYASSCP
jgi:hypothetical protein